MELRILVHGHLVFYEAIHFHSTFRRRSHSPLLFAVRPPGVLLATGQQSVTRPSLARVSEDVRLLVREFPSCLLVRTPPAPPAHAHKTTTTIITFTGARARGRKGVGTRRAGRSTRQQAGSQVSTTYDTTSRPQQPAATGGTRSVGADNRRGGTATPSCCR